MLNEQIYDYLETIKNTNGSLDKQRLIEQLLNKHEGVDKIFRLCYGDKVYGASKKTFEKLVSVKLTEEYEDAAELLMKDYKKQNVNTRAGMSFESVQTFCDDVEKLTGNELIKYLDNVYRTISPKLMVILTRIVSKNLRLGVGKKSINKCLTNVFLPEIEKFEVQLAGLTTIDEVNTFPVFVCEKYDGVRCIVRKSFAGGSCAVTLTSRQGKKITWCPELEDFFNSLPFDFVIDGEIVSEDCDFNTLQQRMNRKTENINDDVNIKFVVYDILSLNKGDGLIDYTTYSQNTRYEVLSSLMSNDWNCKDVLYNERHIFARSIQEVKDFYKFIVDKNGEGVIIKDPLAHREDGKRNAWKKIKPVFEGTLKVVKVNKGDGKYSGVVGNLNCVDSSGRLTVSVGSGLTDQDRSFLLTMRTPFLIDVKYNELSVNKEGLSLRHPSFLRVRSDKEVADDFSNKKN